MAAAASEFLAAARVALDGFDALAPQLMSRPDAEELLSPFRSELHRLNGSAGTFGFPRAGRMAAAMEAVVRKWIDAPDLDRARRADVVGNFSRAMRGQFVVGTDALRVPGKRLLVVGARDILAVGLTTEAAARGYLVERVATDDLEEALEDGAPFAMIALAPAPVHDLLRTTVTIELGADESGPVAADTGRSGFRCVPASCSAAEVLDVLDALASGARAAAGAVLVLDDDPVMRTIVSVAAAQVNLGVTAVGDVASFRAELERCPPALVVVDVEIGDTSGLDLVREIRGRPALAPVPILVLSGHRDDETRRAALDAGAADYLLKPISVPVLAAKLAAWHARGAG